MGEVACHVALYTAASTSERIAFHTINRATGNRVTRRYVDGETGEVVEREAQVKGYETPEGGYVLLTPEEVAAAIPESDKTLAVSSFLPCHEIDSVFLDSPYYLAPSDIASAEAFVLMREGMRAKNVAALAQTVLFRRARTVLVRPHGDGMVATTLNFDYEVRPAAQAFETIPDVKATSEMLDLAEHIISKKRGTFDPEGFDDRYEEALADMVRAKLAGRKFAPLKQVKTTAVVDLMEALRESAGVKEAKKPGKASASKKKDAKKAEASPALRRKAG